MWVDKDDMFADDKVREFKSSNPDAATHIRSTLFAKYMSSDAGSNFAHEYPTGAIADSPIPFSQEHPIHSPVPIIDLATMQSLNSSAAPFVPRPVTAQSSASDVAAMFRQLRVHTPTPLTPDGQRAAQQAAEMFAMSFTPSERRGDQAGAGLEPGAVTRPQEAVGTTATTAN
jgi:hypothetical protein